MSRPTLHTLALAESHFYAGRHLESEALLQPLVERQPGIARAWELLGYIAGNRGQLDICEDRLAQAFALPHCSAEACFYLGQVRLQRGQPAAAQAPLLRSLERGGEFFQALHELGVSFSALDDHEKALQFFHRAERLQPGSHELHTNMASSLASLRRHAESIEHSRAAIRIEPRSVKAWTDLAQTFVELRQWTDALKCVDRALQLEPGNTSALKVRAVALAHVGRQAEALAVWRELALKAPDTEYLCGNLLQAALRVCDWTRWNSDLRATLAATDAGIRAAAPFPLMLVPADSRQLVRAAQMFASDVCPPVDPAPAAFRLPKAGSRLRIAYFSADFGDHPTAQLIAGLFEQHDRARFEVFAFCIGTRANGPLRRRLAAGVDHLVDVAGKPDREAALMARRAGIDIAVDLMGFTDGCRPRIFSHRAAPVQVNWLGFPGSLGTRCIDYLLADHVVVPDADRAHYTEKVVRLPGSYQVNDDRKTIAPLTSRREQLGLPADGVVFACFNGLQKITPDVFDVWMRVLSKQPGSVLWLLRGPKEAAAALDAEARARGVDGRRIVWAEPLPLDQHLARHGHADLFLDTFHYNAHTTCSDALWAGLPVLTLAGGSFPSRVAASLLHAAGLPELVTTTVENYETLALELAASPERLAQLRRRLTTERGTQPLFDTAGFARVIESAFEAMTARSRQGLAPDHMDIGRA